MHRIDVCIYDMINIMCIYQTSRRNPKRILFEKKDLFSDWSKYPVTGVSIWYPSVFGVSIWYPSVSGVSIWYPSVSGVSIRSYPDSALKHALSCSPFFLRVVAP